MTIHANSAAGHNHILHNWEDADATARDARVYVAGDVGKESKLADGTFWRVVSVTAGVATFRESAAPGATAATEGALINSATTKATPVDADMVGLMDSAASNILKKLSWFNVKAALKTYFDTLYASASGGSETTTTTGALINSATAKTTPVDADMLGLMDSAASNVLKKLSWLNLKDTLKTYFDGIYLASSAYVQHFKGKYATVGALTTAYPTATDGDYAIVDAGAGHNADEYIWDANEGWIKSTAASAGTTDVLTEGSTNLYFTGTRAIASVLTGFTAGSGTVSAADSILQAIQKIVGNLSNYAALAGATFTGAVILSDQNLSRANMVDCAAVTLAKGTINATGTVTFDYTAGSVQTLTCGGAYTLTWAFSNWPPTGNKGFIEVQATNMGLGTLAFSGTVNWKQKNDTYTTTFGTYLTDRGGETALKSSGLDTFLFWSQDAGTTIYGTLL